MNPAEISDHQSEKTEKTKKLTLVLACVILAGLVASVAYLSRHTSSSSKPTSKTLPALRPAKLQLALLANGLPNPTGIVPSSQANDNRLFILDQSGYIRIINPDGSVVPAPFLDINDKVLAGGEMGLLGLAFSPHYEQDGNLFVDYIDKNQNTIIQQYHVSKDANKADVSSAKTLLTLKQPYQNHNGGDLLFGSDGYLYVTLGDGGSGGDPQNRAQDLSVLFGKILRLDVSQIPYKIPSTNPFVNQASRAPEIWDYGLRNPWRISFDRKTHELYIADVGQGIIEEINVESPGKGGNNYGWRCFEGAKDFNLDSCKPRDQYIFPVLEYDHSGGRCSITGGYVYRGQKYPALAGKYFYGDYCSGDLFSAEKQNGKWQSTPVTKSPYKISTFGQDSQGELYMADFATGSIYRIQDSAN